MKPTPRRRATPTPLETLVDLSDLHCGSTAALLPPNFKGTEQNVIQQNPVQAWLWRAWCLCLADIEAKVKGKRWALLLNGDLIEGLHHRSVQVISPDVGDHIKAAREVLAPLAERADKVLVVAGTECHVGTSEEGIAASLGALRGPCGRFAPHRWEFSLGGVHVVARHHLPSTTRRALEGSQLSIQLAEEQVNAAAAGRPIPRVLLAAHRHVAGVYERPGQGLAMVTPPWQLLTRFGHKVVPSAAPALQVGAGILTVEHGTPRAEVLTYAPPAEEIVAL